MSQGLPPDVTVVPMYPMYSPSQVIAATLIGGPLAGAWMTAVNYRRLAQRRNAVITIVVALLAVTSFGVLATNSYASTLIGLGLFGLTILLHHLLQGAAFRSHIARQGRVAERESCVRICLIGFAIMLWLILTAFRLDADRPLTRELKLGKCQVYYRDGATIDEARELCKLLDAIVKNPSGFTVRLAHAHGRVTLELVVKPNVLTDPQAPRMFHPFAEPLSAKLFYGQPVDIFLDDDHLERHVSLPWETRASEDGH
jgi:hypothetical protein